MLKKTAAHRSSRRAARAGLAVGWLATRGAGYATGPGPAQAAAESGWEPRPKVRSRVRQDRRGPGQTQ